MSDERQGVRRTVPLPYAPIVARTRTLLRPVGPSAPNRVHVSFVRSGSAEVVGSSKRTTVKFGDALLICPGVRCGARPNDSITATTALLDTNYALDQLFWQHADLLRDRRDTRGFAGVIFEDSLQVLRLGEDRAAMIIPWLDELVSLSVSGLFRERFNRIQSLWFAITDVISPFFSLSSLPLSPTQQARTRAMSPQQGRVHALRDEAREASALLRSDVARRWTLDELAARVHLSPSQLGRVFADAYGKSPIAYLTGLRAELMANRLRTTDVPIGRIAADVGWPDPDFASRQFRRNVGMTPSKYRAMKARPFSCVDPDDLAIEPDEIGDVPQQARYGDLQSATPVRTRRVHRGT